MMVTPTYPATGVQGSGCRALREGGVTIRGDVRLAGIPGGCAQKAILGFEFVVGEFISHGVARCLDSLDEPVDCSAQFRDTSMEVLIQLVV